MTSSVGFAEKNKNLNDLYSVLYCLKDGDIIECNICKWDSTVQKYGIKIITAMFSHADNLSNGKNLDRFFSGRIYIAVSAANLFSFDLFLNPYIKEHRHVTKVKLIAANYLTWKKKFHDKTTQALIPCLPDELITIVNEYNEPVFSSPAQIQADYVDKYV